MLKNEIKIKNQFQEKKSNVEGSYLIAKQKLNENVTTPLK
jgi:hypothetical protein